MVRNGLRFVVVMSALLVFYVHACGFATRLTDQQIHVISGRRLDAPVKLVTSLRSSDNLQSGIPQLAI